MQGASAEEQQDMVVRVLSTVAGPAVPPVYRLFMAPWPWAPFLTAFFTPTFFKVREGRVRPGFSRGFAENHFKDSNSPQDDAAAYLLYISFVGDEKDDRSCSGLNSCACIGVYVYLEACLRRQGISAKRVRSLDQATNKPCPPCFRHGGSGLLSQFLVGPNGLDSRRDGTPGGVFVERCRFLEETNCKVMFEIVLAFGQTAEERGPIRDQGAVLARRCF